MLKRLRQRVLQTSYKTKARELVSSANSLIVV